MTKFKKKLKDNFYQSESLTGSSWILEGVLKTTKSAKKIRHFSNGELETTKRA